MSSISRLAQVVRWKAWSQGGALSRKAVWLAGLVVVGVLMLPGVASAAICTDRWEGPAEGEWQTAADWSLGVVPTSSDVACIGAKETVRITGGSNHAGVVQVEGALELTAGTLEVSNALEASSVHALVLTGTGTLSGAATVEVSSSLAWDESSSMSGSGTTVLLVGASGKMEVSFTAQVLQLASGRTLANEGTLTFASGTVWMTAGAEIKNSGTFKQNTETLRERCQICFPEEVEAEGPARVVNTGTIEKTNGTGTSTIGVPVENQGSVLAQEGQLGFSGGGSDTVGTWSASEGAAIDFSGNSSLLAGGSLSGQVNVIDKASLALEGLTSKAAQIAVSEASLSVPKGSVLVNGLAISRQGTITGAGILEVSGSFSWKESSTMSGSGSTVLLSGASGKMEVATTLEILTLTERSLVNEGTLTFASGTIWMSKGAKIANSGTFNQNSETRRQNCQICFEIEKETKGLVANTGTFEKTEGSSTSIVGVPVENQGSAHAQSGQLVFSNGGSDTTGVWSASEGAAIEFTGGLFTLGGGSWSGQIDVVTKASVALEGLAGKGSQVSLAGATLSVQKGSVPVGSLSISREGALTGAGILEISGSLSWKEYSEMSGSGSTVLLPGASGKMEVVSTLETLSLTGRSLVNEGTLTFASGTIWMTAGAQIKNSGTFKQNSETRRQSCQICFPGEKETEGPGLVVNTGTFEKTEGTGASTVEVPFENLGTIPEAAGELIIKHPVATESSTQYGGKNESAQGQEPSKCGEPVDCATGDFFESQTDLAIGGRGVGLNLTRTYNSQAGAAGASGAFGHGWSGSFSDHLAVSEGKAMLTQANGSTVSFLEGKGESFTPPAWSQDTLSGNTKAGYSLVRADQVKYQFEGSTGRLLSVTDRNGNQTTIGYAAKGLVETITDPAGRKITLAYNGEGLIESAKDPLGHTVKYTYEGGTLASVTLPGETKPRWQYHYDESHQMTSLTDGRGGKTSNEYDGSHRVATQTDPAEHKLKFGYESFHTKITNNTTGSVTDERFTSNNEPVSITRGFGSSSATTETFTYDTINDLTSVTDGNGHKTKYTYDAAANRTSMVDPDEHETKWTYDGTHDVLTATTPNGETTKITRDSHGNAEIVSRPAPGGTTQTTTYAYDANGNLKSVVDPLKHTWSYEYNTHGDRTSETDPEGDKRTFAYDEDSRVISMVSPAGNAKGAEASQYTTKVERDSQGRQLKVTDPLGHIVKYVYDGDGNVETVTDANGHTTTYTYNGDNEKTKVKAPNGATTETGYDGAGHVTSQTDGNKHTTTYVRNVVGEVTEIKDPVGRVTKKGYDAAGNLTAVTDAAGRITKYAYDPANRLKEIVYSDGKTPTVKYEHDADGNRTKMTDGTGKTSYIYDQFDRLIASTNGHGDSTAYEYDLASNQTKLTYPGGTLVTRAYDNAGRLQSVTDPSKNTTTFAYNPNSDLTTITFPKGTGEQDKAAYNTADRQTKITMTGNGLKILASIAYTRDSDGQLTSATTTGLPGTASNGYTYDTNNRLEKAGSTTYTYDVANNPTKLGANASAYDSANQLKTSGATTYTYDQLGDRTSATPKGAQTTTFGYDQAGNLTQVKQSKAALNDTYTYNGEGLRASQTKGKTTANLTWDTHGAMPLILSDEQNTYVYGPGNIPIEQIQGKGAVLYLHRDQQGSTRMITSSTGNIEATTTYDAYGNAAGSTGAATTPLGYDAQYTNADTGLIYLRARSYDSTTAQFLSTDPAGPVTRSPYFYTNDNPLNFDDPSGLWSPIGTLEEAASGVGHVIVQGSELAVHTGLDVAAVGPYALYYGSYELARGINYVGSQFGLPGEVISHLESLPLAQLEALGLAGDIGIDALKNLILGHESVCDEGVGSEVHLNPLHSWTPIPYEPIIRNAPGLGLNGELDIEW